MKYRKRRERLKARRKSHDDAMSRPVNLTPRGYRRPGSLKK